MWAVHDLLFHLASNGVQTYYSSSHCAPLKHAHRQWTYIPSIFLAIELQRWSSYHGTASKYPKSKVIKILTLPSKTAVLFVNLWNNPPFKPNTVQSEHINMTLHRTSEQPWFHLRGDRTYNSNPKLRNPETAEMKSCFQDSRPKSNTRDSNFATQAILTLDVLNLTCILTWHFSSILLAVPRTPT